MSISFESAVATLKAMFPEWDEDTLSTILVSNNYHVENTIETVLSMGDVTGGDGESHTSGGDYSSSHSPAPPAVAAPTPFEPAPPRPQVTTSQSRTSNGAPSATSRYRGLRCDLPPDFLRPPNWKKEGIVLADEELAMMLQNELFQREARMLLGDDFMRNYGDLDSTPTRPSGPNVRPVRTVSRGQSTNSGETQDLGIMKALNNMGAAAKRNLSLLAERFNNSNASTTGNTTRRRGSGSGTRTKGQFQDLDEDEEEGTEIITFGGGSNSTRGHHLLQDHDDTDAENPLLLSSNSDLNNVAMKH